MYVTHKPTHQGGTSRLQQESAASDGCLPRPLGQGHTTASASHLDQVTDAGWGMGNGSSYSPQHPQAGSPIFIWKLLKECSLMYFIWSISFMAKSARALMWVLPTLS